MSIALDFPTETAQLRVIARENQLDEELRVFVPDDDDIMFADAMVVFTKTPAPSPSKTLNFIQRASEIFKRPVYLEIENRGLDNLQTMKAAAEAQHI
jgi:hypothetical protein